MKNVIIHQTAIVEEKVRIGNGTRIWHHVHLRRGASLGQNCIIGKGVYIDAEVKLGNRVKVQNYACVYRKCTIGDDVFIGPHVIITNDLYPRSSSMDGKLRTNGEWNIGQTIIETGSSLGAGAVILPNITIGSYSLVGAGAVVTRDVKHQCIVAGNPATVIGYICFCGSTTVRKKPKFPFVCSLCQKLA